MRLGEERKKCITSSRLHIITKFTTLQKLRNRGDNLIRLLGEEASSVEGIERVPRGV